MMRGSTTSHQGRRELVRKARALTHLPGMRAMGALIALLVLTLIAAVLSLHLRYEHPDRGGSLDLWESVYATFTLLFFGSGYPWPKDALTRAIFFLVPVLGIAVVGNGLAGALGTVVNRRRWEVALASTYSGHVIVCGLGRVAVRIVHWLKNLDQDVVIVEPSSDNPLIEEMRALQVPVIEGDARRAEVLEQAGLRRATSVVPCTNDDLVNLSIATAARAIDPACRVVLRTFDSALAANLKSGFNIHYAFSTSALAAPAFAAAAMRAPVDYAFAFGEDKILLTITEFNVAPGTKVVGMTVADLERDHDVEVLAIQGDETVLNPPDSVRLKEGERFVVSGTVQAITALAEVTPPVRS